MHNSFKLSSIIGLAVALVASICIQPALGGTYDPATGVLSIPSLELAGSTSCYEASLRTIGTAPLTLEVLSTAARICDGQESGLYSAPEGLLTLQAVALPSGACFDVLLFRVNTKPLRLQVGAAVASSCSIPDLPRPGQPQAVTATPGNTTISLEFSAPANGTGGAPTGYLAYCTDGQSVATAGGLASPLLVTGLANRRAYTCVVFANNASGSGTPAAPISAIPDGLALGFTLSSSLVKDSGSLPADYTCDGTGSTPDLAWSNTPQGTREFALLMSTLPKDGGIKWNWVLYNIDGDVRSIKRDAFGVGTLGVGSDGPMAAYQPPCSQGPGAKLYTWTIYALSGSPQLPVDTIVTGDVLAKAIQPLTLGSANLTLGYERSNPTGSTVNCFNIRSSTLASNTGYPIVSCDSQYAYISSVGLPSHSKMDGITASNLQVPLAQNFLGANGWKIPLNPKIAAITTSAVDGPIGVAINGVPIFNPCKQGGCQNGDTKLLGELDMCNGHAGRADDYHYHAAPVCVMAGKTASYWATHPVGWALDGFGIYGFQDASGNIATRDNVCGGNTDAVSNGPGGYSYHVTDVSPYVLACFRGTPSPDFAGQSAKFKPIRQPPVTPFAVSGMTLSRTADGFDELKFTSSLNFITTETGTDRYSNAPGTYVIRYRQLAGAELQAQLQLTKNVGKAACWSFQFSGAAHVSTQPDVLYCR